MFGLQLNVLAFQDALDLLCQQVPHHPAKVVVTPNVDHLISLSEYASLAMVF